MAGFNMDGYVDVAERCDEFFEKHPEGSIQADLTPMYSDANVLVGWMCRAYAYRSPSDERPGVGHAFEPVPGKTPYTKDSEAMNAETSAWGRALVAVGLKTKKIASANEVRNRKGPDTAAAMVEQVQASQPAEFAAPIASAKTGDGLQSAPFTVGSLDGPNANGWYDLHTSAGIKFSTKKQALLDGVSAGDNVMVTWKETTKGQYVNRYIEEVNVLPAGSLLDSDDIPF